jgi:aspartyl-tRNA(Asn)/glutamyl-tRNA(Gln) amidotransferase subunit C
MALHDDDLEHLADLARLDLDADTKAALRSDLERLIGYVQRLQEVDVEGVQPMLRPHDRVDVLRDDDITTTSARDALERLAPAWRDGRVQVPRTVDQDG